MQFTLFNTESRKKEPLILEDQTVRMYTCGPTVYHFAHVGNFRTFVFEDILRRALKYFGFKVEQVMNLTDVDDKTIKGAMQKGITLDEFTEPYKKAFFEDRDTLGLEPVEHFPAATEYFPQMIEMIQKLLEKGIAYKSPDGSIYYAIHRFPRYGCLSHLNLDELKTGASERIANDEYDKESASDFVLWKGHDPKRDGPIFWESPFGPGRPGWHLECSAMAISLLGKTIDLHVGGVDNIFPHHENEIAQSEAYSGCVFARYWMHCEHLIVEGKKMAKSAGNFFTLRDILEKGYTGREIRYVLMHTHYRIQLNFTFEGLDGARSALSRLDHFVERLHGISHEAPASFQGELKKAEEEFKRALGDDLNVSGALGALFDLVREGNQRCDAGTIGKEEAEKALDLLSRFNSVLGVLNLEKRKIDLLPELEAALQRRNEARAMKNWALADELRAYITKNGYQIEDTPQGARLKKL